MDKEESLVGSGRQEGRTASTIVAAQQLMQLSDEESCDSSRHGCNRSSWALKGQSKGSDRQSRSKATSTGKTKTKAVLNRGGPAKGQSKGGSDHASRRKVTSTGKMKTKAVLDQDGALRPQRKRKSRSISEIYAETEPVDAGIGDDHRGEDHE